MAIYLYQWGRLADGHQNRSSATTTTLSGVDDPGRGYFILAPASPFDWRSPQNDNLWQSVSGNNNPCPAGFRLPTDAEWVTEIANWSTNDAAGAFASPLKLVAAGYSDPYNGALHIAGSYGFYWSSTVNGSNSNHLYFTSDYAFMFSDYRAYGFSVRCIKD